MQPLRCRLIGIVGWKNAGKTTLVTRLVARLTAMGLSVSTLKHAHHDFDIDHEGRDSWRHREAGAVETAVVSGRRWALMHELRGAAEPEFDEILARLSPCDLVLVEGYKNERHPKIEIASGDAPLWPHDPTITALVTDDPPAGCALPCFARDDTEAIVDFILKTLEPLVPAESDHAG